MEERSLLKDYVSFPIFVREIRNYKCVNLSSIEIHYIVYYLDTEIKRNNISESQIIQFSK
jgi:hypothetical protein